MCICLYISICISNLHLHLHPQALEILRKFFFVGLITVIFPVGSSRQLFVAGLAAVAWLFLVMLCQPFKLGSDNAIAVMPVAQTTCWVAPA